MRRGISIYLIALLLSLVLASAASLVTLKPIDDQILLGEDALFELEIKNLAKDVQRYSVYSLQSAQGWNIDPDPLSNKIMELQPGATRKTIIKVRPLRDFSPGIYGVSLNVDSDFGEKYQKTMELFIQNDGPRDYLPTIEDTIDMDDKISPGEKVSIRLFLRNRNLLDMKGLKVRLESEVEEFQKEVVFDLNPLDTKTIEFTLEPNKFLQPKDYTLFFVFELNGEQVKVVPRKLEIESLAAPFDKDAKVVSSFLKYHTTIIYTNNGNIKNEQFVKHPVTFWQSLFTFSKGEIEKVGDLRYVVWKMSLSPQESIPVSFTTNYRSLLYVGILLVLFSTFYLIVRSPIVVRKNAVAIKAAEGLSELKITLEVQNTSSKPIKHVSVIDFVPAIGNVEKSIELGTLKPSEIRSTKLGTKAHWELVELDAHDHRIITYKVRAKLNILGTFALPRAIVEFKVGKRKRKAFSNLYRL